MLAIGPLAPSIRCRLHPPVFIPVIKPFVRKTTAFQKTWFLGPCHQGFVCPINFTEGFPVTPHVGVSDPGLAPVGRLDNLLEFFGMEGVSVELKIHQGLAASFDNRYFHCLRMDRCHRNLLQSRLIQHMPRGQIFPIGSLHLPPPGISQNIAHL